MNFKRYLPIIIGTIVLAPSLVLAGDYDDLDFKGVVRIFDSLGRIFIVMAVMAAAIFIIISGIRYMTAGADTAKAESAKKQFRYVLIGTVVILGVGVIIETVKNAVR